MSIDIKFAQILCSRLCHDLVGVSSAANAGLELLLEGGDSDVAALQLSKESVSQAVKRLACYRVAFGLAEGIKGSLSVSDVKQLSLGCLNPKKIKISWQDILKEENPVILNFLTLKVVLNLILMCEKCLPRGGEITAQLSNVDGGDGIAIQASGDMITIPKNFIRSFSQDYHIRDINPQNIHIYFVQELAKMGSGKLMVELKDEKQSLQFAGIFPKI